MFPTKHCFEKCNKKDKSPCSQNTCRYCMMGQYYPIYACTHANHVCLLFNGPCYMLGENLTRRKSRAYGTIRYQICGKTHLKRCGCKAFTKSLFFNGHNLHPRVMQDNLVLSNGLIVLVN